MKDLNQTYSTTTKYPYVKLLMHYFKATLDKYTMFKYDFIGSISTFKHIEEYTWNMPYYYW